MSRTTLGRLACFGALLMVVLLAFDVLARGRGGGGFARGGGGFSRGGGGGMSGGGGFGGARSSPNISRSGPSSGGSFGREGSYGYGGGGDFGRGSGGGGFDSGRGGSRDDGFGERRPRPGGDPSQDRPGDRGDRLDQIKDKGDRDERRKKIKEHYDDHHYSYDEYYEDQWYFAVGTSLSAARFRSLTCTTTTVVASGITYYSCGDTWYNRSYSGGTVSFVAVDPPPGH